MLIVQECRKRGIVKQIGRETIRVLLKNHELKPWREKMWCVPNLDEQYVAQMEDVLDTMERPADEAEPVVALDERPVVLRDHARPGRPAAPGRIARQDYEYVRRGTANIFCIVEPKVGRHMTYATRNRTRRSRRRAAA